MDAVLQYEACNRDEYYQILGCDELSSTEQIICEYKQRVRDIHPDKNPDNKDAAAQFASLQKAKETLCDESTRLDYDRWRLSGMSMSYEDWNSRKDVLKTSLHWAFLPKKDAAIEGVPQEESPYLSDQNQGNQGCGVQWMSDNECDTLKQFRNYEI